jgi:hypothetical protein
VAGELDLDALPLPARDRRFTDFLDVPRANAGVVYDRPRNAWPGSGQRIVVWQFWVGAHLVQVGHDARGGVIWCRLRDLTGTPPDGHPAGEWTPWRAMSDELFAQA